ncbi:transposase IS605 OrfB [Microseira wollei NIES-4236]|uniref:Transposase IS605 OrfB n=2 Tax=Microseira wollei TaxID=467598 RepID=A0AAV3XG12_9CYAN|nr:transposase IS605 OrfB [Microseira wollei NIES-4236]
MKRNLSEWCKGQIQKALEEIASRRKSSVTLVNAAYSSQVDSRNGTLLGNRSGDSFFTFDGMKLQADCNAAVNLHQRKDDAEITRCMSADAVQRILIRRTASFLADMDLSLEEAVNRGWLDRKHLYSAEVKEAPAKDSCPVV